MVFTSCFSRVEDIRRADPTAVFMAVCGDIPSWFLDVLNAYSFRKVAPKLVWWQEWHEKFKGKYESDESRRWYGEKYRSTVLDTLDPREVYGKILLRCGDGKNAYLLCYEEPDKFCHRHMLAAWLNLKLGLDIKEGQPQ